MSLDDLEAKSGVSRSLIYAYEKGSHIPRAETVAKLSVALGVEPAFFTMPAPDPEPAPIFMRHFRSKAGAKFIAAVHRQLPWVRDVVNFIEECVVLPVVDIPNFHPPCDPREVTDSQIEQSSTALRRHWGLGDGVIRDVIKLVENKGCIVVPEIVRCDDIDAFSQWSKNGRPFIVANSQKITGVRWRVDISHEIGHLVLHRMIDRRFLEANPATHRLIENQAFRFARAFLMPETSFRRSLPHVSLDNLLFAKRHWHLSVAAMLYRCEDLGMIDRETGIRMWKNLQRRGWKKNEPYDDQLSVEQPRLLANAIRAIVADDPYHIDELRMRTGLELTDISRYCGVDQKAITADGAPATLPLIRSNRSTLGLV